MLHIKYRTSKKKIVFNNKILYREPVKSQCTEIFLTFFYNHIEMNAIKCTWGNFFFFIDPFSFIIINYTQYNTRLHLKLLYVYAM